MSADGLTNKVTSLKHKKKATKQWLKHAGENMEREPRWMTFTYKIGKDLENKSMSGSQRQRMIKISET